MNGLKGSSELTLKQAALGVIQSELNWTSFKIYSDLKQKQSVELPRTFDLLPR